jgi:hypothetical protein
MRQDFPALGCSPPLVASAQFMIIKLLPRFAKPE